MATKGGDGMNIDLDKLVEKLLTASDAHTLMRHDLNGLAEPTPEFDMTASRVLRSLAFAISESRVVDTVSI